VEPVQHSEERAESLASASLVPAPSATDTRLSVGAAEHAREADYDTNVKAELEIAHMHEQIDRMEDELDRLTEFAEAR